MDAHSAHWEGMISTPNHESEALRTPPGGAYEGNKSNYAYQLTHEVCCECQAIGFHRHACPEAAVVLVTDSTSLPKFRQLRTPNARWSEGHHRVHRIAVRRRWVGFCEQWQRVGLAAIGDMLMGQKRYQPQRRRRMRSEVRGSGFGVLDVPG